MKIIVNTSMKCNSVLLCEEYNCGSGIQFCIVAGSESTVFISAINELEGN
jgi:hypothetical protein